MIAIATTPPTAAPAITPVFELEPEELSPDAPSVLVATPYEEPAVEATLSGTVDVTALIRMSVYKIYEVHG